MNGWGISTEKWILKKNKSKKLFDENRSVEIIQTETEKIKE